MVSPSHIDNLGLSQAENVGLQADNGGLIETIKSSVQPETVANKFGIDKNLLIDIGVYGAIGFIAGFLLKKYSEYFISLMLFIVGIVVLQQFDYISLSFNNVKIHEALGMTYMPMNFVAYG